MYETRDFGKVEVGGDKLISFVQPIFGFESYKKYTLLFDKEMGETVAWLQSLEDPELCFLLISAERFAHNPPIPKESYDKLGGTEVQLWVICVVPQNGETPTVSLKSPVLIHQKNGKGLQLLLSEDYPLRHPV